MIETQAHICTWADATFGVPVSDTSIAARALVEMAELVTACVNGEPAERIGVEIADVVIVLARLGRVLRLDVIQTLYDTEPDADQDEPLVIHASPALSALAELLTAVELRDRRWAEGRLADVLSALVDIAERTSIDLTAAIDAKMAVNRARQWVRDGNGHGRHVEEGTAPAVCAHDETTRGKRIPLAWGSYESEVCKACGAFRARGSDPARSIKSPWRPASEYVEATAPAEDE